MKYWLQNAITPSVINWPFSEFVCSHISPPWILSTQSDVFFSDFSCKYSLFFLLQITLSYKYKIARKNKSDCLTFRTLGSSANWWWSTETKQYQYHVVHLLERAVKNFRFKTFETFYSINLSYKINYRFVFMHNNT